MIIMRWRAGGSFLGGEEALGFMVEGRWLEDLVAKELLAGRFY